MKSCREVPVYLTFQRHCIGVKGGEREQRLETRLLSYCCNEFRKVISAKPSSLSKVGPYQMSQLIFIKVMCLHNRPEVGLPGKTYPLWSHQVPRILNFDRARVVLAVAVGWAIAPVQAVGALTSTQAGAVFACLQPFGFLLCAVGVPALEIVSCSFWHLSRECSPCLTADMKLACPALGLLSQELPHEAEDASPFGEVCGTK